MKQIGLIFGDFFEDFISKLMNDFPQTPPKAQPAKSGKLEKHLLGCISEAFVIDHSAHPEEAIEENKIIPYIQILKKDKELFKDTSNVHLMYHMMILGFNRVCITGPGEPPLYGYEVSPSKDLLIALEEDTRKRITGAFRKVFSFCEQGKEGCLAMHISEIEHSINEYLFLQGEAQFHSATFQETFKLWFSTNFHKIHKVSGKDIYYLEKVSY